MPRLFFTLILIAAAGLLAYAIATRPQDKPVETSTPIPTAATTADQPTSTTQTPITTAEPTATTPPQPATPVDGLHVIQISETQPEPQLGSDTPDPKTNPFPLRIKLSPWGAGVIEAKLSRYSEDVALHDDDFSPYPVIERVVRSTRPDGTTEYSYPFASYALQVNGQLITLFNERWRVASSTPDSAVFEISLADSADQPVLKITRTWRLEPRTNNDAPDRYALRIEQRIDNLSDKPLDVQYAQFGPMDMVHETSYVGDQRHVILGYLHPRRATADKYVSIEGFYLTRAQLLDPKHADRVWPADGDDPNRDLLWLATTNRYFTTAVHATTPSEANTVTPLESSFPLVSRLYWGGDKAETQHLALMIQSAKLPLEPGASRSLDLAIYAGPKSRDPLQSDPTYAELGLTHTIVYNLGGCCATCTFEWLANALFSFMSFIHDWVADWGFAIIVLVALVRTVLHPLTKGSQVNMMKLSKQMQTLQPELEKLKKKYPNDKAKLQQETMALYREKHINPASMGLGCLPMFLQMPIWIALYAMLYFAIELRQQPAFWGVFQNISGGSWPFLADLSGPDNFLPLPESMQFTLPFFTTQVTAINILPILMGIVFFLQQKYMTPANPNMSPEMRQQQTMMKWMMVTLFPLMLFWAPSGLTLYILTSTAVGIVESKRVRAHVKDLEDRGELHTKKPPKPGGFMDRLMKAATARQEAMAKQQQLDQRSGKKRNRTDER